MAQKDYKLEVVNSLLQEPCHPRRIASKLGTNPMLITRKIHELEMENVVDYNQRGRNKIYFLKKTSEARAAASMAENYKLMKTLERYPALRKVIEAIQKNPDINLALLFGSYAKGNASKDSDIDIYVESKDVNLRKNLRLLDSKLSLKIGAYEREAPLIKEIEKNHVAVKGVERFFEKNRFFE